MKQPSRLAVGLLLLLASWEVGGAHGRAASGPTSSPALRVVMLGTGTPNADPDRSGPSVAVIAGGRAYLVDCGPGVVRRAAAAAAKDHIPALAADQLGIVFITHLHSDHTLGLPDLMLTPWVLERRTPLEVYGPPGVTAMTRHLTEAYWEDIQIRQHGLEPDKHDGWKVHPHEIAAGVVYRDSNVTVTAFEVPHANWKHAFGYRFESHGESILISGDTRPSDAIVRACDHCDVLVHEVYSAERFKTRTPEWQAYHANAHTSTIELARLAARARPKLLVLYHQLFWGATDEDLVREVRAGYDGLVVSARDLDVFPAEPAASRASSEVQASFEALKALAGTWKGTVTTDPHNPDLEGSILVTMRVASGGNVLLHEIAPGGVPEPTTIYVENDRLTLVHYCEAGNRPRLVARETRDPKAVDFDFVDISGSKEPTYLSHFVFQRIDPGHHTEDWTFALPGGQQLKAHFDLRRAGPKAKPRARARTGAGR